MKAYAQYVYLSEQYIPIPVNPVCFFLDLSGSVTKHLKPLLRQHLPGDSPDEPLLPNLH